MFIYFLYHHAETSKLLRGFIKAATIGGSRENLKNITLLGNPEAASKLSTTYLDLGPRKIHKKGKCSSSSCLRVLSVLNLTRQPPDDIKEKRSTMKHEHKNVSRSINLLKIQGV